MSETRRPPTLDEFREATIREARGAARGAIRGAFGDADAEHEFRARLSAYTWAAAAGRVVHILAATRPRFLALCGAEDFRGGGKLKDGRTPKVRYVCRECAALADIALPAEPGPPPDPPRAEADPAVQRGLFG